MKKRKIKIGKKGFFQDIISMMIFLLMFALCTFIALVIYNQFRDHSSGKFEESPTEQLIMDNALRTLEVLDYCFIIILMGFILSTCVTAFFIKSHPILFILSLIMVFIVLILAVTFSNVFETFSKNPAITNATDSYVIIPYVFSNFPLIILCIFVLVGLAFFAKSRGESGGL